MTTIAPNPDRLYHLLPELYRIADSERGRQLQALLALITQQVDALRLDTQQLWDDFFIETCQHWVIPYIGELVGNNPLHDLDQAATVATAQALFTDLAGPDLKPPVEIRTRADVAKTIYYRRRTGTPAMLEELARDVTGWGARVVEFFTRLDWNQHLEHLRPDCQGCPDLRRVDAGDRAGGPWDTMAHTADVRRINAWDGWYNLPNLGFFLWRLRAYPLNGVTPRAIGGASWRLTFSPLGQDLPLFSAGLSTGQRQLGESRMARETDIEAPIRGAAFFVDPAAPHDPIPPPSADYYGDPLTSNGSLVVLNEGVPVPLASVRCMNLAQWSGLPRPSDGIVGIDVTRGRLIVPTKLDPKTITVSYFSGFSADLGGGEYPRANWLVPTPEPILISGGGAALDDALLARLAQPWPPTAPDNTTVLQITDDATYDVTHDIILGVNESLVIQAADGARPHLRLPQEQLPAPGVTRSIGIYTNGGTAELTLSGLLVEGGLRVEGDLDRLRLLHTTLVPGRTVEQEAALPAEANGLSLDVSELVPGGDKLNTRLQVQIAFSIVGALRLPAHVSKLVLLDSIVDGVPQDGAEAGAAIADAAGTSGPSAHIERSTIVGSARFLKLELASESIFTGQVSTDQQQQGCVRFCYVPRGSTTPQRFRCQPALEIERAAARARADAAERGLALPAGWHDTLGDEVARWLVPSFSATQFGRPDFAQLSQTCPIQIRTGAEDGSEMGAFCHLKQPQRESNLRIRLDEYLPVGLEAGLIYVT